MMLLNSCCSHTCYPKKSSDCIGTIRCSALNAAVYTYIQGVAMNSDSVETARRVV